MVVVASPMVVPRLVAQPCGVSAGRSAVKARAEAPHFGQEKVKKQDERLKELWKQQRKLMLKCCSPNPAIVVKGNLTWWRVGLKQVQVLFLGQPTTAQVSRG